jgi:hypothetical protein
MKLTDAEWQWDRRKVTIFFTAEKRVDFRGLVRDLAALFRARIELKQIGVRDEAKRLSGIGRCGREYCSASWLPDLRPVNLGVAKDQKLSLNPQQISGACGRLMCCLRYEHEFYVQSRRRFPKEGRILTTSRGEEKVISCDIFNERVTLRSAEGDTRVVALVELKSETDGFDNVSVAMADATIATTATLPLESAVASMLDTMEFEAFTLQQVEEIGTEPIATREPAQASILSSETAEMAIPTGEPVVADPVVAESVAEPLEADAESEATDDDDAPVEGESEAAAAQRRKRRRGRRGGRRLRAAEERRKAETGEFPVNEGDAV